VETPDYASFRHGEQAKACVANQRSPRNLLFLVMTGVEAPDYAAFRRGEQAKACVANQRSPRNLRFLVMMVWTSVAKYASLLRHHLS